MGGAAPCCLATLAPAQGSPLLFALCCSTGMTCMLGLEGQDQMIGRVLLGRYRIMAALAQGGMGVVYLARMEGSAGFLKPVVIKLILPGHTQDPDFVGMFEREAHILSLLRD